MKSNNMANRSRRCVVLGLVVATCLGLSGLSGLALAQPPGQSGQRQESQRGPVSQREALERVRARFPGNVISINEVRQGNRARYRIRIDNDGNIFTVFVDKATGAISRE